MRSYAALIGLAVISLAIAAPGRTGSRDAKTKPNVKKPLPPVVPCAEKSRESVLVHVQHDAIVPGSVVTFLPVGCRQQGA